MDQIQDQLDPEVAREVIRLLNRKITNLRDENAQLQSQLSRSAVKIEDENRGSTDDNTQCLLQEIEHLRSELEHRRDPEVAELEEKLKRSKRRRQELEQNLESQVEQLRAELEEAQSARLSERAIKEALEKEIEKLCQEVNRKTHEKDEALLRIESQRLDNFNVRQFLSGTLEELPPTPNPIVVTGEGKPRFKGVVVKKIEKTWTLCANGDNRIKWANQGGGCVIPFPPVVYNGRKQVLEKSPIEAIENRSYEFFGLDARCVYYGTYRCTKVTAMNWTELTSLDDKFSDAFLRTTVVQDDHAAPLIRSLTRSMYKTGILKVGCAVLRCEGFNETVMGEVNWPRIKSLLIYNSGKRPHNAEDHNVEGSQGTRKKPRLGSN